MKTALLAVSLLAGIIAAADAGAQHRHGYGHRGGVYFHFGGPWYPYWYYPYYYPYYYPPVVVQRNEQPVYVERDEPAPEAPQGWWFFCEQTKTYYPYVKTCPGGWQKVAPTPPAGG
jgi:hypothetical protein